MKVNKNIVDYGVSHITVGNTASAIFSAAADNTSYLLDKNKVNTFNSGSIKINEDMIKECQQILGDIKNNLTLFERSVQNYENALVNARIREHMHAIANANFPVEYKIYSSVGSLYGFMSNSVDTIYKNSVGITGIKNLLNELDGGFKYMLSAQDSIDKTPGFGLNSENTAGDENIFGEIAGDTTGNGSTNTPNYGNSSSGGYGTSGSGNYVSNNNIEDGDVVLEDEEVILEDDPIIYDSEYPEDENIMVEEIDNNQNNMWNDDLLNSGLGAGVGSGVVYPWVNDWNNNWDNTGNNPWDQNWNGNGFDPINPTPGTPSDNDDNKDDGKPEVEFVNIGPDEVAIETPLVAGIGGGIIGNIGVGGGSTITKPEFNDPTENKKEPNIDYAIEDMEFINPAETDPRFMANDDLDTLVDDNNINNLDENITDSSITDSTINNEENNLETDNNTDILDNNEIDNLESETESGFFKTAGVAGIGLAGLAGVGLKKDKDKEKKKDE